ncbi:hypothetical protein TNCV_2471041 [Trichonephila clavipes]|nr:hypothetical protein TNCV_2471041 [Trichonephila clavipes]
MIIKYNVIEVAEGFRSRNRAWRIVSSSADDDPSFNPPTVYLAISTSTSNLAIFAQPEILAVSSELEEKKEKRCNVKKEDLSNYRRSEMIYLQSLGYQVIRFGGKILSAIEPVLVDSIVSLV